MIEPDRMRIVANARHNGGVFRHGRKDAVFLYPSHNHLKKARTAATGIRAAWPI
jgi:hypothetical protein